MVIDQIKELFKKHDWFFEYCDDQRYWRAGLDQKREILNLMQDLSIDEIKELFNLIPEKVRPQWFFALEKFDKPNS